jgi:putative polyhydroxyalkanoate system protein
MSDIHVVEAHNTTADDALTKIGAFEDMLKKYHVKPKWSGHEAKIKGPGVKGSIKIDGSNVTVDISLGMIARAAGIDAKRLEGSISKRLRAAFDAE